VVTGEIFLATTAMQQLSPSVIYRERDRPEQREDPRPLRDVSSRARARARARALSFTL
jgi:hypothetical protein